MWMGSQAGWDVYGGGRLVVWWSGGTVAWGRLLDALFAGWRAEVVESQCGASVVVV